ncbi:MAG TPA: ABC transporter ATP-binding protein [Candidatus Moranbacteria bacterium]|nr:ABC transporter ATP-binding protein [Candidatus Moranbacteria bacterium]
MNILSVENLGVRYEQSIALDGVTFSVEQGDFVGIAGPNGAGKTTLIKAIFGLIPSFSGAVSLFGEAQKKFAKWQSIGYLPQKNVSVNPLFPAVVEEVVLLGLISEKSFPKKVTKADKKAVREILEELGIGDLRKKSFTELSGGQYQRVLLARALVQKPELLIFDEPSTALDPQSRDGFFELLLELNQKKGITILFITHDTSYIQRYASKILYLDRKVMYFGTVENFFQKKEFRDSKHPYHIHYSHSND